MSEGGRLSRKLDAITRACSNASILEARRLYGGGGPCADCGATVADPKQETPLSSDVLEAKVTNCFSAVVGRQVGPESARMDGLIQRTLDAYANPANPDSRFVAYRGPYIPPVCPPIPTAILNANIPKASRRCPLPNKGYNPNLPA
jgi:hypothetical protein